MKRDIVLVVLALLPILLVTLFVHAQRMTDKNMSSKTMTKVFEYRITGL